MSSHIISHNDLRLKDYIYAHRRVFAYSLIFALVCFGFMLTNHTTSIDEEGWVYGHDAAFWVWQGRFSIWIFDLLFTDGGNYVPFLWDFLSVVLWHLSGVISAYTLLRKYRVKEYVLFIFCAYYSSVPFSVGEILSFSQFNLQVCTAVAATSFAVMFTVFYFEKKCRINIVYSILLLIYAIGTYQAVICIYATGIVSYCLISFVKSGGSVDADKPKIFRFLGSAVAICAAGTALFLAISKILGLIMGQSGYLDNYIGWTDGNPFIALGLALANVARVLFAIPYREVYIYGGGVIRTVTVMFVIYAVVLFFMRKGAREKLNVFFWTLALCFAPFALYIAVATYKTHGRMLLAVPLFGSVAVYLIFELIQKKTVRFCMLLLVSYLLFMNACNMNMIYYYNTVAYKHDYHTAVNIMQDISDLGIDYSGKQIAFVGMIPFNDIPVQKSCNLGSSVFEWDDGSNGRMAGFLLTMGYNVVPASTENMKIAAEKAADMPMWPDSGSIIEDNGIITVHLSSPTDDWYINNRVER